jgi:hypothetical protein
MLRRLHLFFLVARYWRALHVLKGLDLFLSLLQVCTEFLFRTRCTVRFRDVLCVLASPTRCDPILVHFGSQP